MKTIVTLFTSTLVLLAVFALARAQTNSPQTFSESRGQSWLTNYYGKTVSSLGEIVTIQINRKTRTTPDWAHHDLWQIIEESKLQPYPVAGIPFGVPPVFTIEYSDGLRVQADRFNILISLPDGRKGSAFLTSKPQTP